MVNFAKHKLALVAVLTLWVWSVGHISGAGYSFVSAALADSGGGSGSGEGSGEGEGANTGTGGDNKPAGLVPKKSTSSPLQAVRRSPGHISNKLGVAVIIGDKDYQGHIPDVDFAHNDADAFRMFVVDMLGYDPENIIDLRDATQAQLQSAFGNDRSHEGKLWRYLDPKGQSDVTVFYSGHGVPGLKDKRGYLLPVNADPDAPEINGFPLDTLLGNLAQLSAKSISVFLDACFSGDSQKGMIVRAISGITLAPKLPESSTRMTVITAAQGDQVASWDLEAKHGMFTKYLLDALYGKADAGNGDGGLGNGDHKVSLGEVRDYLNDHMTRAARRTYGRHQKVWVTGDAETTLASIGQKIGAP